jgi:mycothiol synthase
MNVTVRPANLPGDYAGISAIRNIDNSDWPTTPEALAHQDSLRNPKRYQATFVAEHQGQIAGWATLGHDPIAHREGKFNMHIQVPPALQRTGIGSKLYRALTAHLTALAPTELQTEVWETLDPAIGFVTRRGFVEAWRRVDLRLDVSNFDPGPNAGLEERVRAMGIAINTYADLEHDSGRLRKLYELDRAIWQDVPYGEPVTVRTLEQFCKEEVNEADFLPEACFIAVRGQAFAGYSYLSGQGSYLVNEMTGVRRDCRGRGLATLLKLHTIRYAQAHGGLEIRTTNDSVNAPMLALNHQLGFRRDGAMIRFTKRLA